MPWRPDFGSLLYQLKHQPNDEILEELARVHILDAISRWDSRVDITDVSIEQSVNDPFTLLIQVAFNVIDTNTGTPLQEGLLTQITV